MCCLIATLSGAHARGADASRPHPHAGELAKYQAQAPIKYGLSVDNVPLEKLRSGKPVLRMTTVEGGFKRSVSIQDVHAPPSVVWGRIMDLAKYPKMVEGCVECEPYRTEKKAGGTQVVYARYKIRAAAITMEYFMKHVYEPKKDCMTFHLDYEVPRCCVGAPRTGMHSARTPHVHGVPTARPLHAQPAPAPLTCLSDFRSSRTPWATGTSRSWTTAGAASTTLQTRRCPRARGWAPVWEKLDP